MRTWIDIEQRFRNISRELDSIRLDHQWGAAGDHWHLAGGGPNSAIRQFEALAGTAGRALERSLDGESAIGKLLLAEKDPRIRWYRALKELSGEFKHEIYAIQKDQNGNDAGYIFSGNVGGVGEVSANLCLNLAASHPIRDDRTIWQRLYDDYGREIVIGTIIAVITAIVGLFFGT